MDLHEILLDLVKLILNLNLIKVGFWINLLD